MENQPQSENRFFQIIESKIDSHLINGGPTRIINISKELLVEAAALNHLISPKISEVKQNKAFHIFVIFPIFE
jgi:hypothetical protein